MRFTSLVTRARASKNAAAVTVVVTQKGDFVAAICMKESCSSMYNVYLALCTQLYLFNSIINKVRCEFLLKSDELCTSVI